MANKRIYNWASTASTLAGKFFAVSGPTKDEKLSASDLFSLTVPFAIPSPTGEGIQPDLADGNYQYCWINTDTTLIAPTPAPTASVLYFEIQYANGAYLLDLDASIKMPAAVRAVLPVTLEIWKSHLITLRVIGGVWCLVSITGPNTEVVD